MTGAPAFTLEQLNRLFSVVICIDESERAAFVSDTATRYVPELVRGSQLFEQITFLRPTAARCVDSIREHLDSLFLMKALDESFAARGQMLEISLDEQPLLCFCGSPWLFWMNSNVPDIKLGMGDFSPQDAQLDQLFLMTTEKRMVSDLEKLNAELTEAKVEVERAQEAKSAMFARMSHEMRTPLNGVVSALSLLADHDVPAPTRELLDLAGSCSKNLLHVINYVLDVSKMETGEDVVENEPFDLTRVLRSVTDIVRSRAIQKGLDLGVQVSAHLQPVYRGDKAKLRQCLLNLLTNAIRFTGSGEVVVRAMPAAGGENIRFEVRDTGVGISEEDQQRIFDPFWSSSEKGGSLESGTGLGLDIVRRSVQLMGGTLGVESTLGEGTLFWFELPLEATEAEPAPAPAEPVIGDAPADSFSGRVLLVDDNTTNLMLGKMILNTLGVEVGEALDGSDALTQALAEKWDLVLMDINMPGMDGVEATIRIREERSSEQLPIVALTAYASAEEKERCLRAGMDDYLTKPIVRERLAEQLQRWLRPSTPESADGANAQPAAAPEPPPDEPVLDIAVLDELKGQIGEANVGIVLDQFENEVKSRYGALEEAIAATDLERMIRESHTLASTCRSLGLLAAGDVFSALEGELRDHGRPPEGVLPRADAVLSQGLRELSTYRG